VSRRKIALAFVCLFLGVFCWGALRIYRLLVPDQHGAKVTHFTIKSKYLGRSIGEIAVAPKGGSAGRPLLVLLHGHNSDPSSYLTKYWFDALAAQGDRAPDLLLVNGGYYSYYHNRRGARWGDYVMKEVIPDGIARLKADGTRIAIGGISMGGFGSLLFGLQNPGYFCAVGGHSPAMWKYGGETPLGAFDDAEDFARVDVMAMAKRSRTPFGSSKVWIDVGTADSFYKYDKQLALGLRRDRQQVTYHFWPGGHGGTYWSRHIAQYMKFYANALAHC